MNKVYDFIVIGSGISACTFASFLNKRFPDASILLVDQGRRIGGRSTTRQSRKNKFLEFNHGLPSISFSQNISQDIMTIIEPLIHSKKLIDISNNILIINEFGDIKNVYTNDKNFRSVPFMINFCEEIINQSINPIKINFLFQTLSKSIRLINGLWDIEVSNERILKSKNLILSSSLLAHPRCIKVLKTTSLPLREAFEPGKDEVVDSVLRKISKQQYIFRQVYIFYVSNFAAVKTFSHEYLQVWFSNTIRDESNFERIIFQKQRDGSMIFVLHCSYMPNQFKINLENIIQSLISIFVKHRLFRNLFLYAKLIDRMDWRASQTLNHFLPQDLQWSSTSRIGFCGDWVDSNNFGGVESAMNSAIRLAKVLNWK